jgi:hypothetical protein
MSRKSPTEFFTTLLAEIVVIAAVVAVLPRVPLGQAASAPREKIADQRPSLARGQPSSPEDDNWRTSVSRPNTAIELPPADPAYVERRLDEAGEQLMEGAANYLSRHARELLTPRSPSGLPRSRPLDRRLP